jgi:serine/threonine-protein kinase
VQPAEGATLEEGDRVTLVPSLGHAPVPVPDVGAPTLDRATRLLRGGDLRVGKVTRQYSDEVAEGRVIDQSPGPGQDEAPFGSRVDLVLSKGPFPVNVPKVTRMTQEEATARLADAGFEVAVDEDFSDQVPRGEVISQEPARGTELQPGNTVTIVVSLGPEEFALPNLVGMSKGAAEARLLELGLVPRILAIPGGDETTVVSQLPVAGTLVRAGDSVTIYVA